MQMIMMHVLFQLYGKTGVLFYFSYSYNNCYSKPITVHSEKPTRSTKHLNLFDYKHRGNTVCFSNKDINISYLYPIPVSDSSLNQWLSDLQTSTSFTNLLLLFILEQLMCLFRPLLSQVVSLVYITYTFLDWWREIGAARGNPHIHMENMEVLHRRFL